MREWGAILAENALCYLVERCRDFTAWWEKGCFAVYGETGQKTLREVGRVGLCLSGAH